MRWQVLLVALALALCATGSWAHGDEAHSEAASDYTVQALLDAAGIITDTEGGHCMEHPFNIVTHRERACNSL